MRETELTLPEVGLIGATRGILGAGVALLLADRVPEGTRKILGWTLVAIGAVSTIPLALTVLGRSHCTTAEEGRHRLVRQRRESRDQQSEEPMSAGI
jgi:hypothetical protein